MQIVGLRLTPICNPAFVEHTDLVIIMVGIIRFLGVCHLAGSCSDFLLVLVLSKFYVWRVDTQYMYGTLQAKVKEDYLGVWKLSSGDKLLVEGFRTIIYILQLNT